MRVVVQRVRHASVHVNQEIVGQIEQGYLLLVGITHDDNEEIVNRIAKKCVDLRIFEDEDGKMNKSIEDVHGAMLSISQFTLYADCKKGRRPSFIDAARPETANPLYEVFNQTIRSYGITVETGIFGADMKVDLCNDGPVTIILDSKDIC